MFDEKAYPTSIMGLQNRCEVSWTAGQPDTCGWLSNYWDIFLIIVRGAEGEAACIKIFIKFNHFLLF